MNIFESFATWLKNLFKPLIDLYHEDSSTFFAGAIIVLLVLLIIVIWVTKRAENDDKPSRKIKYEDIDWSLDGENSKAENSVKTEAATVNPASSRAAASGQSYGIGEVDVDKNTFGHEGLPPEITEALMRSIRPRDEDLSVPMWMTKQTLSLEDIDMIDAQEWVEEQLTAEETKAHDSQVEKATVERIAEILEKIDLCDKAKEDYKKRKAELAETETPAESEKIDLDVIAPLEQETAEAAEPVQEAVPGQEAVLGPEAVPGQEAGAVQEALQEAVPGQEDVPGQEAGAEPEVARGTEMADIETGTLAKILKEAEEIRAEGGQTDIEPEETGPDWGIAETLARLEAMQAENDSLLKEIEEDGDYFVDENRSGITDPFGSPADLPEEPIITSLEEELADSEVPYSGMREPEAPAAEKKRVRRFGLNNRDTNRSGRKFTEEELMKQIRD